MNMKSLPQDEESRLICRLKVLHLRTLKFKMKKLKVGLIREGKVPHDRRVPFTPDQCVQIKNEFPNVELIIQPSPWRSFTDDEYTKAGITLQEDVSDCDIFH